MTLIYPHIPVFSNGSEEDNKALLAVIFPSKSYY